MKFTVQYIPLSKIKPDLKQKITEHIKKLERLMWDCMFVLVVKKNRKDGTYTIISGQDRFESLKKHTKSIYAPCIVDKRSSIGRMSWFHRLRNKQPLDDFPLMPPSWSIFRSFLKQEPRFKNLSRADQIRVMLIAVHYKKTVIYAMKSAVDHILSD
jgi:DNA-directed RNA polymerase subunit E'/Rpb7